MAKPAPAKRVTIHTAARAAVQALEKPSSANLTQSYVAAIRVALKEAGVHEANDASDRRVRLGEGGRCTATSAYYCDRKSCEAGGQPGDHPAIVVIRGATFDDAKCRHHVGTSRRT